MTRESEMHLLPCSLLDLSGNLPLFYEQARGFENTFSSSSSSFLLSFFFLFASSGATCRCRSSGWIYKATERAALTQLLCPRIQFTHLFYQKYTSGWKERSKVTIAKFITLVHTKIRCNKHLCPDIRKICSCKLCFLLVLFFPSFPSARPIFLFLFCFSAGGRKSTSKNTHVSRGISSKNIHALVSTCQSTTKCLSFTVRVLA